MIKAMKSRFSVVVAVLAALTLTFVAACSGSSDDGGGSEPGGDGARVDALFEMLPDDIQKSKTIKMGTNPNAPPENITGVDGVTTGMIPDLAHATAKVMGVEMQIQTMDYPGLIPALMSKKIDINWSVIQDTEERQKSYDFVDFFRADHTLLVAKGNPKNIDGPDTLCGTAIGAVKGGSDQAYLEEHALTCKKEGKPALTHRFYDKREDPLTQILSGNLDGYMGVGASNASDAADVRDGDAFEVSPGVYMEGIQGIAFRKESSQLRDAFQAALKHLVENGTYNDILKKWGIEEFALTADEIMINGVGNGLL